MSKKRKNKKNSRRKQTLVRRLKRSAMFWTRSDTSWGEAPGGWRKTGRVLRRILLSPWLVLVYLVRGVWNVGAFLLTGVARIWKRRTGRVLLQSCPALFGGIAVVSMALAARHAQNDLVVSYRNAAVNAYARGNFDSARVYYERLVSLDGGKQKSQFDLALSLVGLDEVERAEAIMRDLASFDANGFGRAHLWVAHRMLMDSKTYQSPEKLDAAYTHLTRAQQALPDSPEVNLRMSQFLVAVNRNDEAVSFLVHACKFERKLNFELAMLLGSLGREEEGKEALRRANNHYRLAVRRDPMNKDARLRLASILVNLDDFDGAIKLLREGQVLHPNGPFSRAIAHAFITRFDKLHDSASTNPALKLELLRIALLHDPDSREALTRLLALGESTEKSLAATSQMLEALIASGYANAFAHFVLGCKSWEADEKETAIFHFERAYKLDETLGPVANNLAWILTHKEEPQLPRALELIASVLRQWPENAAYRDTKGQILVKMERWHEALDDLEFALRGIPEDSNLHTALATTYAKLGRHRLAEKHLELAAHFAKQASESHDK